MLISSRSAKTCWFLQDVDFSKPLFPLCSGPWSSVAKTKSLWWQMLLHCKCMKWKACVLFIFYTWFSNLKGYKLERWELVVVQKHWWKTHKCQTCHWDSGTCASMGTRRVLKGANTFVVLIKVFSKGPQARMWWFSRNLWPTQGRFMNDALVAIYLKLLNITTYW